MTPRILTIAGSDSGGGAGIQADLKTIMAFGGYGMSAITAITAQNTLGVSAFQILPASLLTAQISDILMDLGADAIKIGMVGSPQNVAAISDALVDFTGPIILDPVMIATSGARLGSDETTAALISLLVPRAHVVTPNIPEAEYLAGIKIETRADMLNAAQIILAQGPKAVLVKGGHLPGDEVADLLFDAFGAQWFEDRKINTRHTHGTGCTLASAIASNLGQGRSLQDAVIRSRAYVRGAIETAPGLGQGHGPLNHLFPVRD